MFNSTRLVFSGCTALRIINHSQILNSKNVSQVLQRGYAATICNYKINNIRLTSNNSYSTTSKPVELEKVYYGLLTPQIKAVKIVSFTTSIGGIVAQPILMQQITKMGGGLPVIIGLCSFIGFFTFITPLLLHIVTKKYITHLDYNPESKKYIATVITFFCRQQKIEFSVDDVKVPEVPGMFTTFLVKGRPLFVDPNLFADPTHYGKLMGYDKPIDFKLYDTTSRTAEKKDS